MSSSNRRSRYRSSPGIEGEYQPGSRRRVLRNLAGIKTRSEIDQAEYDALDAAQKHYVEMITSRTRFTASHICRMHRDWLGRIYSWAGSYRTVEMAKGTFHWPPARFVAANMSAFEQGVLARYTPCRSSALAEVARGMAEVQSELLLIHPFREGNGRIARWLTNLMAMQAGLPALDYRFEGAGAKAHRTEYLDAVIRGYATDYDPLTALLERALRRAVARLPDR